MPLRYPGLLLLSIIMVMTSRYTYCMSITEETMNESGISCAALGTEDILMDRIHLLPFSMGSQSK